MVRKKRWKKKTSTLNICSERPCCWVWIPDRTSPRGEELLKRSAAQGNIPAKYLLGKSYLEGILLIQNIPEGIRLITEAADSSSAPGTVPYGKTFCIRAR